MRHKSFFATVYLESVFIIVIVWSTFCCKGRKAVLGMVKKSKYSEALQADLEERRTTSHVKFPMKYHIHDIVGAELVER